MFLITIILRWNYVSRKGFWGGPPVAGVHADRTARSDCDHRNPDWSAHPCRPEGQGIVSADQLREQPEAAGSCRQQLRLFRPKRRLTSRPPGDVNPTATSTNGGFYIFSGNVPYVSSLAFLLPYIEAGNLYAEMMNGVPSGWLNVTNTTGTPGIASLDLGRPPITTSLRSTAPQIPRWERPRTRW